MAQNAKSPQNITIDCCSLKMVHTFTYIRSTIPSLLSLDPEVSSRIAKATSVMAKLNKRVWSNNNLTENTKLNVYQACVLHSILFYMAVRPGQHMPIRKRGLITSTSSTSGTSSTFPGRTEWPMQISLNVLPSQAYLPFSVRDISGGWATSVK